jgi:hypothetical protein
MGGGGGIALPGIGGGGGMDLFGIGGGGGMPDMGGNGGGGGAPPAGGGGTGRDAEGGNGGGAACVWGIGGGAACTGGGRGGVGATAVFGGSGGGADGVSRLGGGGGTGPRLGGGGGAPDGILLPAKGGGTPNLPPTGLSSSGTGVFGGRGGGGGPGFAAFDEARALFGGAGGRLANFPASAIGGGALKTGFGGPGGGEGSRGGDGGAGLPDEARLMLGVSVFVRRAGGGAGGGPRRDAVVLPVFWGLIGPRVGAALGGGGGGALDFFSLFSACIFSSVFLCSMYSLMKSAFSSIWSSVMPIASNSFSRGCHDGSVVSMAEFLELGGGEKVLCDGETMFAGGMMDCGDGADCAVWRCPKMPPSRPWPWELFPFAAGGRLLPAAAPNGLFLVFLCAFFSRSSSFFLNVLASFSSAKDSAAKQSSSSNVWKKTRSWLYEKVSYISWSQMTPRVAGCCCQFLCAQSSARTYRDVYHLQPEGVAHQVVRQHRGALQPGVGPSVLVWVRNVQLRDGDGEDLVRGFGHSALHRLLVLVGENRRHGSGCRRPELRMVEDWVRAVVGSGFASRAQRGCVACSATRQHMWEEQSRWTARGLGV